MPMKAAMMRIGYFAACWKAASRPMIGLPCWLRRGRRGTGCGNPGRRDSMRLALGQPTVAGLVLACSCSKSSTFRNDSGYRTYIITARRMISGEVLK